MLSRDYSDRPILKFDFYFHTEKSGKWLCNFNSSDKFNMIVSSWNKLKIKKLLDQITLIQ